MSSVTPKEQEKLGQLGQLQHFDFGISYSSLEHAGLGRYGDPLNAVGDLQAMSRISCMLKPGGLFFLDVVRREIERRALLVDHVEIDADLEEPFRGHDSLFQSPGLAGHVIGGGFKVVVRRHG